MPDTPWPGADLRYCGDCEGAPAYPIPYHDENEEMWVTWLCSSSGCVVGDDVKVDNEEADVV
jgi:hypothetical protein